MYVVEIGGMEVFVYLLAKGDYDQGIEPTFEVSAGTDWEGEENVLTEAEKDDAVLWVITNYPDEVYRQWD